MSDHTHVQAQRLLAMGECTSARRAICTSPVSQTLLRSGDGSLSAASQPYGSHRQSSSLVSKTEVGEMHVIVLMSYVIYIQ